MMYHDVSTIFGETQLSTSLDPCGTETQVYTSPIAKTQACAEAVDVLVGQYIAAKFKVGIQSSPVKSGLL